MSPDGKMARCGRSDSFEVIEIGTNWKPVCDFLLVFHCNYIPVFYRFRDITFTGRKFSPFQVFAVLPISDSFECLAMGSLYLWYERRYHKLEFLGYPMVKTAWSYNHLSLQRTELWLTDGRTDRRRWLCLTHAKAVWYIHITQAWKQTSGDPSGQTWNYRGITVQAFQALDVGYT